MSFRSIPAEGERLQVFLRDLVDRVAKIEGGSTHRAKWHKVGDTGEPAFQNSWTNLGIGYREASFKRDGAGFVTLRGVVSGGSAATAVIFTLPSGFRPVLHEIFVVDVETTGAADATARVNVNSSGTVQVVRQSANGNAVGYTSLSGIRFSVN